MHEHTKNLKNTVSNYYNTNLEHDFKFDRFSVQLMSIRMHKGRETIEIAHILVYLSAFSSCY